MQDNKLIVLGNTIPENPHQSTTVYGVGGVAPNIMSGTHGYGFGYILEIRRVEDGKATDIQGGYIIEDINRKDAERTPNGNPTDIATSLLERDCKGLGNYSNGVIEIWKVEK